jgi:hypothetical protein
MELKFQVLDNTKVIRSAAKDLPEAGRDFTRGRKVC